MQEVGLLQLDLVRNPGEVVVRLRAGTNEPDDVVALLEQELREIGAVLTADAGDQCPLHAAILPVASA